MSTTWDGVWEVLNVRFQRIADSLRSNYPEMSWSSGRSDNESFPFRAYATYNRDGESDDDIVVSVDFHRSGDTVHYSVDIGLDDGQVLADGPGGDIAVLEGPAPGDSEISAAAERIAAFLDASGSVLQEHWM